MRRLFIGMLALVLLLSGCTNAADSPQTLGPSNLEFSHIEPVGTVPEEFQTIVEENLFGKAKAFSDRLLKLNREKDQYVIQMYNFAGEQLLTYTCTPDDESHTLDLLVATADGGFLFVLGFYDYHQDDGSWSSEQGVYSRVIKCSANGELEWEARLENYTSLMLDYCFEREDAYYFFGAQETPETARPGIGSFTDIHAMKMSKDGQILKTAIYGGSDYDIIWSAYDEGNMFRLACWIQSTDGDFVGAKDYQHELMIDTDLRLCASRETEITLDDCIGLLDGQWLTRRDLFFQDFADGSPTAVIDYGDFYLIVSENATGYYPHEKIPLAISSIWLYTETVYGAYDKSGNLLWKATVDSSPDYDARVEDILKNMGQ